ncbi:MULTISPECIES: pantetheine-phosphate adenylyltransferase [Prochlorococcus]|uniref:Phosphopantetheine adenylyltransferase n=1 Tax=Prochlorococcus marinus (strain SARG / CCMP1375 / SS120) TaxID=167539 RepID=COAD_PROMA|nr:MULTISPECIES: pantetheine-phosphate adenylyltransferase [Prochlorococcus]Q7VBZ0.1 RecName: Full=Phosphopantetheine adenylyltransferase; AltName: Full=Dephospho-CoA pyrophosphorylase; AltName: Full=Pantetheine-phosphate adenylyltransferase; Short=PPAT [Prochlorococcus marinus subsp. marinus str. CCMP1375]AAP99996.1 Phosphopantetheine adenylyltransferase [Prochlorococcus marinus subsp. marinus str. CCMP1375]KGG13794.1 Phosphopantetheine adenylyltransferase [Prochlorococcus marinus str. LG]KGG1
MKVLYPGSFDPLTLGHLDLIHRASVLYEEVIIAVLENSTKSPTFSVSRRIEQIKESTKELSKIKILSYKGLTVECAKSLDVDFILRGLRAMSDFEYELQIAHTNRSIDKSIETIFLATEARHSFLSSSVVKEVAMFGGNIDHMVPAIVAKDLYKIYKQGDI